MELALLNDIIKSSKNILLTSHVNPDGDTLGSMCGLYELIESKYKKKCDMLAVSKISKMYEHIPNVKLIKQLNEYDLSREYDLVINLDVAAIDRMCDGKILFDKAKKQLILITTKQIAVMLILISLNLMQVPLPRWFTELQKN